MALSSRMRWLRKKKKKKKKTQNLVTRQIQYRKHYMKHICQMDLHPSRRTTAGNSRSTAMLLIAPCHRPPRYYGNVPESSFTQSIVHSRCVSTRTSRRDSFYFFYPQQPAAEDESLVGLLPQDQQPVTANCHLFNFSAAPGIGRNDNWIMSSPVKPYRWERAGPIPFLIFYACRLFCTLTPFGDESRGAALESCFCQTSASLLWFFFKSRHSQLPPHPLFKFFAN